ncbi:FimD/PapC N-terminal domain-containing protein [Citrobacter sp. R56]|uniref:FimD/PapC N-terminal domain-containing protein n=1 Tax=Citrobacter sp. R56 TaxID=1573676 RepID=UPI00193B3F74|nr:FimD/PapC N-terminal domain-containing protein [Citrobacter sp. R56]QRG81023.1 FimD/PapC N-terminal domain-containing protein [Citrobacter sp. R56]
MIILFPIILFLALNILIVQCSVAATGDMPTPPAEDQVEFDSDFVKQPAGQSVDLARFSNGANVLPGVYKIAVALNQQTLTVTEVEFKAADNKNVIPCIPLSVLNLINFKKDQINFTQWDSLTENTQCINLKTIIPEAELDFDNQNQQLNISIPQIFYQ